MSGTRRLLIALGAPLVVVLGLSGVWAGRNATQLKAQIEHWVQELEHSPGPVTMKLSLVPAYVDGDKVGMLRTVVVHRQEPGAVDGVDLVIEVGDRGLGQLAGCSFQLDPHAFDHSGPFGFKHALECVDDVEGLMRFGTVSVPDADFAATLYADPADVACNASRADVATACSADIRGSLDQLRATLGEDLRAALREAEIEIENARIEVQRVKDQQVTVEVRTGTGGN